MHTIQCREDKSNLETGDEMKGKKVEVLNVEFDNLTHKEFVAQLAKRVNNEEKTFVVTANPEIVMYANANEEYMNILKKADYITADGIGIVKGAHMLGTPIVERVAGYDLMLDLFKEASDSGKSIYLLGAKQEVIEKAAEKLKADYPGINLVGYRNGYFKLTDQQVVDEVVSANADLIFVGLGYSKQEKWILQYFEQASKGLAMGIGGAFDAYTGTVKRAPKLFIKLNLEWLYRLIKQPTRFKRMLSIPEFLLAIQKEKKKR